MGPNVLCVESVKVLYIVNVLYSNYYPAVSNLRQSDHDGGSILYVEMFGIIYTDIRSM